MNGTLTIGPPGVSTPASVAMRIARSPPSRPKWRETTCSGMSTCMRPASISAGTRRGKLNLSIQKPFFGPRSGSPRSFTYAALTTHLRRALAGHVVSTDEFSYALPSLGRKGWMRARCVPWRDAAGAVVGVVGFLVDVTDRRRSALFVQAIEAIGQSLTSSLDLDQVLDTIGRKALEVMGR